MFCFGRVVCCGSLCVVCCVLLRYIYIWVECASRVVFGVGVRCALFVVRCSLFSVWCLMFVHCKLLFVVWCGLFFSSFVFVVCCLRFDV